MQSNSFKTAYDQLNTAQRQAVDTIDGPVMVIAGPGTGKTQILTLRIANILQQTDASPDSILALTFTESGAKAMRERLVRYIGAAAYRVTITTFHSFAGGLIGQYPDAYPTVVGGQAATDLDRIKIVEDILDSGQADTLRPNGNPQYYVKPVMGMISDLKREYVSPDRLGELIAEQEAALLQIEQYHVKGAHKGKERGEYKDAVKKIDKNRALQFVYRAYEAALREQKLYDFDDMIVETVKALESDEDMLRDLQERYQYLLADEHQDVNGAQNKILELLASYHDRPNIFVVGDEKQAIYRFQGASLENFLHFETHFTGTTVISLTENYRSGQEVLDAAHDLVKVEEGPLAALRAPLTAMAVKSARVTTRTFPHQAVEDSWVVEEVAAAVSAGTAPQDIAVIVRSNWEVEAMAAALRAAAIATAPSADGDILSHSVLLQAESLLRAVGLQDKRAVFEQLHAPFWGVHPADIAKICGSQSCERTLLEIVSDATVLEALSLQNISAIEHFVSVLSEGQERTLTDAPHIVLAYLVEASGMKTLLIKQSPHDGARVLRRIYDEVEGLVRRDGKATVRAVLDSLQSRRDHTLPLSAPFVSVSSDAVQVMTAHKSKGLEFDVVFAPHLVDSVWGGKKNRSLFHVPLTSAEVDTADNDDEVRLLYVLMTRARHALHLSYSEQNADGRPLTPSRLLSEIGPALLEDVETDEVVERFSVLDGVGAPPRPSIIDADMTARLFTERGFSATSLNNYLKNPYDYYFKNLLRIPDVQTLPLLYGTAVHDVLRRVTVAAQAGNNVDAQQIISWLEQAFVRLPLSTTDYTRLHAKSLETVIPYALALVERLPKESKTEFPISVLFDTGDASLPLIPLKGNLDRIDFDEQGGAIRVFDYKTGKPKSRNQIEGNAVTSDGAYKRQLVFYALLLELYDDDRFRTRTGVLSFVESGADKLKEEVFEITQEEIDDLKKEITTASKAMVTGNWISESVAAESDFSFLLD